MEKDFENKKRIRFKDIEDLVDEHIPCVYGPPASTSSKDRPSVCIDAPIGKVYGPMPPKKKSSRIKTILSHLFHKK